MKKLLIAIFSRYCFVFRFAFRIQRVSKNAHARIRRMDDRKTGNLRRKRQKTPQVQEMRRNRVGNVYGSGTLNDNGVFYITMVQIAEDGSETENVVEVLAWTEKNGVVTLCSNGQFAGTGKIVDGYFVPDDMIS